MPLTPELLMYGESVRPLFSDKKPLNKEAIYFHFPPYHQINSMGPSGAIREREFNPTQELAQDL